MDIEAIPNNKGRNVRRVLVFLVLILLIGCHPPDEGTQTDWTALSLSGKVLDLVDSRELQWFPFSQDGTSSATVGLKEGPVAAPILFWKIKGNTLQLSVMPDSEIVEELHDPAIKGNIVSATRKSGVRARYVLSILRS